MRILVLGGCGAMGTEATRDLAATSDFEEIAVADIDLERARSLCRTLGGGRLRALRADVAEPGRLPRLLEGYDLVLNCTSYAFGLGVTRAAIAARRPVLDLGGLYNTPRQLALDERAREAGATVVLGMGATPGVTNLMARAGAAALDRAESVSVAFASLRPLAPSPGLLATVLDEFSADTRRYYFENGEQIETTPFSGERRVRFADPVGELPTWYVPHSELHTLPRFLPDLRKVEVRGTWAPRIMAALRLYHELGLLSQRPLAVGEGAVSPRDFLFAHHLAAPPWPPDTPCAFFLHVEVAGVRGGSPARVAWDLSHPSGPEWDASATARVTGIPASVGAQHLAAGGGHAPGVFAPEAVFDPERFFADLAKRDIAVRCTAGRAAAARAAGGTHGR